MINSLGFIICLKCIVAIPLMIFILVTLISSYKSEVFFLEKHKNLFGVSKSNLRNPDINTRKVKKKK